MFHVSESFVRWLAPVLSFTAEEIWGYLPGTRDASVFYETWYEGIREIEPSSKERDSRWQTIISVRNEVSKQLETLRIAGVIGSSLDAEVELYCSNEIKDTLDMLNDEMRFVLITSYANIKADTDVPDDALSSDIDGLKIVVKGSTHAKCARCWHHREDVNENVDYPEVCSRCIENISGSGEERLYA